MIPQNYIKLEGSPGSPDDSPRRGIRRARYVQNVHSNFDIDEKLLEEVAAG